MVNQGYRRGPYWLVPDIDPGNCFYVAPRFRRRGLSVQLLRAAVKLARSRGASAVEGYPIVPSGTDYPPAFASIGLAGTFTRAGFRPVVQPSPTRLVMRYTVR
ncbi:MAG: GNAT family N-acetyltransferase [Gemmatimonadales bacterium]